MAVTTNETIAPAWPLTRSRSFSSTNSRPQLLLQAGDDLGGKACSAST